MKLTTKQISKLGNLRHFKMPYKRTYTKLLASSKRKKQKCDISYDDFINFTKIKLCHYCFKPIKWVAHGKKVTAYYLDRKDNSIGYTKDNCVVCCTRCNLTKSDKYDYEEWFGMTEYFRRMYD